MFAEESCSIYSKADEDWRAGKSFYGGGARGVPGGAKFLKAIDIQAIKLPPHSPNLNAHLERWHRSVKEEIAMRRRNQPIHSNLPAWHRSQDAVNLARMSHPNV